MAQQLIPGKVAFIWGDPIAEAFFEDLATLMEKKDSFEVTDKTNLEYWKVEFPDGKIMDRFIYAEK